MTTRRATTGLLLVLLALIGPPAAAHATTPAGQTRDGEFVYHESDVPPPPGEAAPAEPVPEEPAPAEPEPADPEPVEAVPVEPAPEETPGPVTPQPPEAQAEQPPEPQAEQPPEPVAVNRAHTVQVIVQVQVGCRHHCEDTSQTQTAIQHARTDQTATAPDGTARNQSVIQQYVWQLQLGCVAFCSGTVQTQTAEQRAQTTQTAIGAESVNSARTIQVTQQRQRGWRGRVGPLLAGLDRLLRRLARETSATMQLIRQVQIADCLHHCTGDAQVQLAMQQAVIAQEAAARSVPGTD
jgi:hypothetical protein